MVLTKRDSEFFIKLRDYGLMTTRQVALMHFPGVALTTVLRRLRKLERAFYIQRVTGFENFEVAWAVTSKVGSIVGEKNFKRHFRRDTLDHDLKLTSLRLALEGSGLAWSWIPEHEIRSQVARRHGMRDLKERIIPDGLMGIKVGNLSESVVIELELNFKNQKRYARTLSEYSNKRSAWAIWYLVGSPGLGRHLEKLWWKCRYPSSEVKFIWSIIDEVISKPTSAHVFGLGRLATLGEIWLMKAKYAAVLDQKQAAQPPALGLSREDEEKNSARTTLSTENNVQKMLLAS